MKLLAILAIFALTLTACATQPASESVVAEKFTIGAMLPLSGDVASYGIAERNGALLALKELGLVNSVEMVFEDTGCDAKTSVSAINKLVGVDKVQVIFGETCSGATLAASPVARENKVLMVSPSASSPKITDEAWVFRTIPSDAKQGAAAAKLLSEDGHKNVAVLYGNEDYGKGIETVLQVEIPKLGGTIVASEAFEVGSVDLRGQITKINSKNPDAIYLTVNSFDSAAAALKQIRDLDPTVPVYGSEGLRAQDIIDASDGAAEGLTITAVSLGSESFKAAYLAEFGEEAPAFAAQGYDAMMAIGLAVKGGAKTGEEFRTALLAQSFDGATGTVDFDENGDLAGGYAIEIVKDGAFVVR